MEKPRLSRDHHLPTTTHVKHHPEYTDKTATTAAAIAPEVREGDVSVFGLAPGVTTRDITPVGIVAIAFNICNSWTAIAASLAIAIASGGTISLIYGMIVSFVMFLSTGLSLAELAAVYPTAGGQYHFTSILAPARYSKGLSYFCGMTAVFSWIALCAAVSISTAQPLIALVQLFKEDYVPKDWHYFLVFEALLTMVFLYNIFALKRTPWVHDIGFALTMTLFIVVTITCVSLAHPKKDNDFVWNTWVNGSGWPAGVCFLTGLVTPCFMFAGIDSAMHLAEEVQTPARIIPRAIVSSIVVGFVSAFAYTIGMLYCIKDFDAVLNSPTNFSILEVYRQATGSRGAAGAFCVGSILIGCFVLNACQQTASRLTWSFARDNGIVFSNLVRRIHPKLEVPVNALIVNWAIVVITGVIYVASSTAFNALVGTGMILQQVSFAIPTALLIYHKRSSDYLPSNAPFRLPSILGWAANISTIIFSVVIFIFFQIPVTLPVTGSNMSKSLLSDRSF
ncbi:hypothetical protein A1O3_05535 [Capronia epimyces CBS 606.96]|uniref:Choline transport protein n=1 Tax=Capronia epimyces CBS 606.96 TaxID=1182542 RepID=W9Y5H7_9EURO|nr:uncharacterized protein A1O3_05535 [Capronia epimyces CBS 606.96]EXJ84860.1 hypothetical protein A1O3_05535 [Capronia epimyces CBS 606.96]